MSTLKEDRGLSTVCPMGAHEIDYEAELPPYRQIADVIIEEIDSGALPPGKRAPTESTLMQQYGVARATARRAVQYLREQDYVRTVPQRGSYVIDRAAREGER
jgi:GntR family transcriptional regulator